MGCLAHRRAKQAVLLTPRSGLRGESQPIEPDPGHAGGGRDASAAANAPRRIARTSPPIFSSACASAGPRVHCITNAVAQNFTANMLLAAGAVPSMTIAPKEVGRFAARADALLVNLGTFDAGAAEGVARGDRRRQQGRHSLGARSGVHRPLAAARGVREEAGGDEAASAAAQRAGVQRAVGRQDRRCGAGALRQGATHRGRPDRRARSRSRRASASRPSPTAIR